jgi:hypothetical protein
MGKSGMDEAAAEGDGLDEVEVGFTGGEGLVVGG